MSGKKSVKLTNRDKYTVRSLVTDLKKIGCTPRVLDTVGREVVYFEWSQAQELLGEDHPVTTNLAALLEFMSGGCEKLLIEGDLWRAADTSSAAINEAIKGAPKEFLSYQLLRSASHIRFVLDSVLRERSNEMKEYKRMEKGVRRELKSDPDNAELWNKMRLLLWILGRYKESSEAFQKAKKLGWDKSRSHFVAI